MKKLQSKVTTATWMGYDKVGKDDDKVYGYIPYNIYNRNLKSKIAKMILNKTVEIFGVPDRVEEPEGIVEITHIGVPGKPYLAPTEGISEEQITTGLIKKWCVKTNKQNCLPCDWNVSEMNEVERLKDLLKKVVEDSVLMFHAIDGEDRHTCDFCHAAPCASRECKHGIGCRWRYEKEIRNVLGGEV